VSLPVTNYTFLQLQQRSDGGSFQLVEVANTPLLQGTDQGQRLWTPPSPSIPRTLLGWTATYRTRPWSGPTLVFATSAIAPAVQYVLNAAWTFLDVVDLRLGMLGRATATMGDPLQGLPVPTPLNWPANGAQAILIKQGRSA
jgi:hypothetical protein